MIALNTLHISFNLDVSLAILLIIGTLERMYVKAAHLPLNIKIKLEDVFAPNKDHIFQIINAFNVYLLDFGTQHQKTVKYAHKHLNLTFINKFAFVLQIFHFYKMDDV